MKNLLPILLLVSLLVVGVLLIYQEAQASIIPCTYAQFECEVQCGGTFSLGDCWRYQGILYCWFTCSGFVSPPLGNCEWQDPTHTECQGEL